MSGEIKVVLVDGDPNDCIVIQDLLSDYKRIEFSGIALDLNSFKTILEIEDPDIVIVDQYINPDLSGLDILRYMQKNKVRAKPVVFSSDENNVLQCYRLGAFSYILKNDWGEIVPTIKKVYQGMRVIPGFTADLLLNGLYNLADSVERKAELSHMSPKESNVLNLLVKGESPKNISKDLGISHFTVKRHLQNIREKASVKSTRQLIEKFKNREKALV